MEVKRRYCTIGKRLERKKLQRFLKTWIGSTIGLVLLLNSENLIDQEIWRGKSAYGKLDKLMCPEHKEPYTAVDALRHLSAFKEDKEDRYDKTDEGAQILQCQLYSSMGNYK